MSKTGSLTNMIRTPLNIRRELSIVLITLCCSVIILPGVIFAVGSRLFGAYGSTNGVLGFYQAVLSDLVTPRFAAWIIVFAPALCIALVRLTFRLTAPSETPDAPVQRMRREPTLDA